VCFIYIGVRVGGGGGGEQGAAAPSQNEVWKNMNVSREKLGGGDFKKKTYAI
jgi:hypothetical protein